MIALMNRLGLIGVADLDDCDAAAIRGPMVVALEMRDESLLRIISGADPADEDDVFLRASLAVALRELDARQRVEERPAAHDAEAAGRDEGIANGTTYDGNLTPIPFPARRAVQPDLRSSCGWAIATSAAAAMIFGGGVMTGKASSERADLLKEVTSYHRIYSRETEHLVEVPAEQAEHLTAWLGERLARSIAVPDLTAAGLRFAGGRMLVLNDHPAAELMYSRDGGPSIAICVSRIDGKPWPLDVEQQGALRVASWAKDAYAYVVVGEFGDAEARDLARRVAAEM